MSMGIGTFLSKDVNIKRKYRWAMEFPATTEMSKKISPIMVTIAARPSLTIEETEINFMNEKDYIPAKPTWDTLSVTFLDYAKATGTGGGDEAILEWIKACYWLGDPTYSGAMSDPVGQCRRDGTLRMLSGTGYTVETWTLYGCWVSVANWGDLDYSATDNANIETTIRFQNADCKLNGGGRAKASGDPNQYSSGDFNSGG